MKSDQMQCWEWGAGLLAVIVLATAGAFLLAPLVGGAEGAKSWMTVGVALVSLVGTLLVGLTAASIAHRQMLIADHQRRVAADKFNFDLFKERYEVFAATRDALFEAHETMGGGTSVDAFNRIKRERARARFLFGSDIADYIGELVAQYSWIITINEATRQNGAVVPHDLLAQWRASQMWVLDAAKTGIEERFGAYLDFSHWRPGSK